MLPCVELTSFASDPMVACKHLRMVLCQECCSMAAQGRRCTPVEMRCWSAGRPQAAVGRTVHYRSADVRWALPLYVGFVTCGRPKSCLQPSAPMI